MATYVGKDVSKLKGKGGKWKYMSEQTCLRLQPNSKKVYRSFLLFLGKMQARVKVAEPLPLLNGRVQLKTGTGGPRFGSMPEEGDLSGEERDRPPPALAIAALKGQIINLHLLIKNIGNSRLFAIASL